MNETYTMHILIIKLSSMGDIIHTLPALTDALLAQPSLQIDWLVDNAFAEIPLWHPGVKQVIVTSHRKWKKNLGSADTWIEIKNTLHTLRLKKYDFVIDAQSSIKSAIFSSFAKGTKTGFDFSSAREAPAAIFYKNRYSVTKNQHALNRIRELFGKTLNYAVPSSTPDYGLNRKIFENYAIEEPFLALQKAARPTLMFIPNASWGTKLASTKFWRDVLMHSIETGYQVIFPWGNEVEKRRVEAISTGFAHAIVLPKCSLKELASLIIQCQGVLSVDTGLAHLAAALSIPGMTLYGPTSPKYIGTIGQNQKQYQPDFSCLECKKRLCTYGGQSNKEEAACLQQLNAEDIWRSFYEILR